MAVRLDHDGVANRAFALPRIADAREGPAVQRRTLESQPAADQPDDNTPFRMITRIKAKAMWMTDVMGHPNDRGGGAGECWGGSSAAVK